MNDPQDESAIESHRRLVRSLARPGGPLSQESPYLTVRNEKWFVTDAHGQIAALAERDRLHNRLLSDYRDRYPGLAFDRRAVILAGPPGAGKSSVLPKLLDTDLDQWLIIDPDEFKRMLIEVAIRDGSYESDLKPPEIRELEARGEIFHPLELAPLVHQESSRLAYQLRTRVIDEGANFVLDAVLSKKNKANRLGEELHLAEYEVEIIDVEVTYETSKHRVAERWRRSRAEAFRGEPELGGRWVPSDVIDDVFEPDGSSKSASNSWMLFTVWPNVRRYRRIWNGVRSGGRHIDIEVVR